MKKELCAGTAEAVRIARKLGFDRVELCQQLEVGGITPSAGMQRFSAGLIETHVLIRVRGGGFVYSQDEKEIMLADIAAAGQTGVHGVVVGALDANGNADTDWLKEACHVAGTLEMTFHRAFDEVADWQSALESLLSLGFRRILTAGQATDVVSGKEMLKAMSAFAAGRIEIMAGGGVKATSVREVIDFAQPDAIHFSGTALHRTDAGSRYAADLLMPDEQIIREILARC